VEFEEASAWISSHPFTNPLRFESQATKLGPDAIPGMIAVLADGPMSQHTAAALVLSCHGVTVAGHGETPRDYEYLLTMPDGERQVVRSVNLHDSDFVDAAPIEMEPTLDEAGLRRFFVQYAGMFALAGGSAFAASQTSGAVGIVFAVVAGLLSAVALWSTLFMGVIRLVLHKIERLDPG
jgi:hypothetical protein